MCHRASELAFSLDPLPLNEIPPQPELAEVSLKLFNPLCMAALSSVMFNSFVQLLLALLSKQSLATTVHVTDLFSSISKEDAQDLDALCLAKSYFDLKEYDRSAYFLRGCRSQKAYFLYMYSRYLVRAKCIFCVIVLYEGMWKIDISCCLSS